MLASSECACRNGCLLVPASSPCIVALLRHAEDRIAAEQPVRLARTWFLISVFGQNNDRFSTSDLVPLPEEGLLQKQEKMLPLHMKVIHQVPVSSCTCRQQLVDDAVSTSFVYSHQSCVRRVRWPSVSLVPWRPSAQACCIDIRPEQTACFSGHSF